jgi:hypothetical protein
MQAAFHVRAATATAAGGHAGDGISRGVPCAPARGTDICRRTASPGRSHAPAASVVRSPATGGRSPHSKRTGGSARRAGAAPEPALAIPRTAEGQRLVWSHPATGRPCPCDSTGSVHRLRTPSSRPCLWKRGAAKGRVRPVPFGVPPWSRRCGAHKSGTSAAVRHSMKGQVAKGADAERQAPCPHPPCGKDTSPSG